MSNPQGHDPLGDIFPGPGAVVTPSVLRGNPMAIENVVREQKDQPAKTYDAGKLRFDLLPPEWEEGLAAVMTKGAEKYAPRNWQKGLDWGRRYASLRRHLNAFWAGEDIDPESGLHHLVHVAWNALAIYTFTKTHPEFDDRVKKETPK